LLTICLLLAEELHKRCLAADVLNSAVLVLSLYKVFQQTDPVQFIINISVVHESF